MQEFKILVSSPDSLGFSLNLLAQIEYSEYSDLQYVSIQRNELFLPSAEEPLRILQSLEDVVKESYILPIKVSGQNIAFSICGYYFELLNGFDVTVEVFDFKTGSERVVLPSEETFELYGTPSKGIESLATQDEDFVQVPVFYGTNRNKIGEDSNCTFGLQETSSLTIGLSHVSVPNTHETGKLERPNWFQRKFTKLSPKKYFLVLGTEALSVVDFNSKLDHKISEKEEDKDILLYIHGFNMSFEDSLLIAAQLSYDLSFEGAVCSFSWPSRAGLLKYGADYDTARSSANDLISFLEILAKSNISRIHILAHSMGNIALSEALRDIGMNPKLAQLKGLIGEVILAAPDVNQFSFKDIYFPNIHNVASRFTMYACDEDLALRASALVRLKEKRLGSSKDGIMVLDGMDSIDGTGVSTKIFTLNHSNYAENKVLLTDIHSVLAGESPAKRYLNKILQATSDLWYWKFSQLS